MKNISSLKFYWYGIIVILLIVKFAIYDSYHEMKQQQIELLEYEKQLSSRFKTVSNMKDIVQNLEKVKKIRTLYSDETELNKMIEDIICHPVSNSYEMKYNLKLGTKVENSSLIQYPFKLEVQASFNSIGDYLEYLESINIPLVITKIMMAPTASEFDRIKMQLVGISCLPK